MNKQWLFQERPTGRATADNFEWREQPFSELTDGEVRVRTIYLSLDPANRGWMNQQRSYTAPIAIGTPMRAGGIGVVEASAHPDFAAGDLVQGMLGWQSHPTVSGQGLTKLPALGVPLDAFMSVLGHIGMTAYFGLLEIGQPKEGETLVVSAAAGAVGSLVGQIGKIKGCHVVGIAGTDDKCEWLKTLGFDATINYKTEDVAKSLRKHCPNGIDIYFENVGGKILDAVLAQVNVGARIPLCGLISQYNATEPVPGPYNFASILVNRVHVEGFIVTDYNNRAMECLQVLGQWLLAGKLQYRSHIVEGLEKAPEALNMLFDGANKGKLILQVSEPV